MACARQTRTFLALLLAFGWATARSAGASEATPENDHSLAPYLMVVGEGHEGTENVPLKETTADVTIAGVIARVQVHQTFENTGRTPIEAVYVFPASTRAAVHGVRMKIGARTIEAKIDKRAAARESYEAARREGRRASLLEQERANVFMMSVANILPGDRIGVEMDYSELLVPEEGIYELVYPTVVGPRYAGGADPAKDKWIANPHLPAGTPEPYRFDVKVHLETSIPIKDLSSPSHQLTVKYPAPARADVALAVPGGGNRDFVLRYRLSGDKIESGLLLWEGEGGGGRKENFFALMMEPPQRPQPAQIPPREYIFLLDVSGSMHGFPLDTAKALMRNLLGRLRPTDTFNVALFSGAARVMFPEGSRPASKTEVANATGEIERQQGGGGTELMGGLAMSYRIPKRDRHASRTVVVVTDGFVGVEAQAFRFIRERLSEANLFAFGIGSSVNRGLIEGMARAGQGEPFVVLNPDRAATEAEKLRAYVEQPVLTNVNVKFAGLDAYDVAPQKLPDLMARRPLVLYGKYRGAAGGRIDVSGQTGGGAWHQTVDVRPADVRTENAALRWLWARNRVATLEDDRTLGADKTAEDAITTLGLDYRLLTAFTSFVAVDSQVVNKGGQQQNVRQPLPMPEGVSNLAVAQQTFLKSAGQAYGVGGLAGPSSTLGLLSKPASSSHYNLMARANAAPPMAEESDKKAAKGGKAKDDTARASRWTVAVDKISALGSAGPLVKAIESSLASRRAACAAAIGKGTSLRLKLTVDAHGKVLRVDVLGGDRSAAACVVKLLTGTSSATKAASAVVGTIEVTVTSR